MMLKESIICFLAVVDKTYRYRSKRRFVAKCPACIFYVMGNYSVIFCNIIKCQFVELLIEG